MTKPGVKMSQFQPIADHSTKRLARPLIKCRIKIKIENRRLEYKGIFPSTADAFIDAKNYIGLCNSCITVTAIRKIECI
jgi:hypothetical protein